jgi:hypothetical protein
MLRLVGRVHQLRHAGLHAEGHLVLSDAGGDLGMVDRLAMPAAQLLHRIDDVALLALVHARGRPDVQHGIALGMEGHALEAAGQEPAVPLTRRDRLALSAAHRRQDHEAGQIVALAAQPVQDPRSHARASGDRAACVHERVRRIVVDRVGLQRSDDANVVRDRADVRQYGGDFLPGLAPTLERELRGQALELLVLQLGDWLALGQRGRHRLAVHLGQLRLVIQRFQMRRAAGHAKEDDRLGPRWKM